MPFIPIGLKKNALILLLFWILHWDAGHGWVERPPSPLTNLNNGRSNVSAKPLSLTDVVRRANRLSQSAAENITAAEEACQLWESILEYENDDTDAGDRSQRKPPLSLLPKQVQTICFLLHANCLVRVGNDQDALRAFDRAKAALLSSSSSSSSDNNNENGNNNGDQSNNQDIWQQIIVGKASSLQRLLLYRQAMDCFWEGLNNSNGNNNSECAVGAATCALRLGRADLARQALDTARNTNDGQAMTMRGILMLLPLSQQETNLDHERMGEIQRLLSTTSLGRWVLSSLPPLNNKHNNPTTTTTTTTTTANRTDESTARSWAKTTPILDLVKINVGPWDDPLLVNLDDKVALHQLLNGTSYWPRGYVLPDEQENLLQQEANSSWWMKKERSGYGSHGNEMVQLSGLLKNYSDNGSPAVLLQSLIHPTYLLPNQKKFSLRIYVVYLMGGGPNNNHKPAYYISREGLVKVASVAFNNSTQSNSDSDDKYNINEDTAAMFMTNSGRQVEMVQQPLTFLQELMTSRGDSFDALWQDIIRAVQTAMDRFFNETVPRVDASTQRYRTSLASQLGLPKILGLDFLVDANGRPWLIEINRFPGMQARDEVDAKVKETVLRDAWILAAEEQSPASRGSSETATTAKNLSLQRIS